MTLGSRFWKIGLLGMSFVFVRFSVAGAEAKPANPPVKMAPFEVTAIESSVKVKPLFRRTAAGPILENLTVVDVIANSVADRLGVTKGMRILEYGGKKVMGMTEQDFDLLWRGPFWSEVTIKVVKPTRSGWEKPQEITFPLRDEPIFSFQVSSTPEDQAPSRDHPAEAPAPSR